MIRLLSILLLTLSLTACYTTITPQKIADSSASFDGNERNSGLIALSRSGGAIVTPRARERYNGLIALYGRHFTPPLTEDYGVTVGFAAGAPKNYTLTKEALVKFATMNRWKKEGKKP